MCLPRVPFQKSMTGDQNCRCKFAVKANGDELARGRLALYAHGAGQRIVKLFH